jgi:hypothetical protein
VYILARLDRNGHAELANKVRAGRTLRYPAATAAVRMVASKQATEGDGDAEADAL